MHANPLQVLQKQSIMHTGLMFLQHVHSGQSSAAANVTGVHSTNNDTCPVWLGLGDTDSGFETSRT